jgi:hypothetical protein
MRSIDSKYEKRNPVKIQQSPTVGVWFICGYYALALVGFGLFFFRLASDPGVFGLRTMLEAQLPGLGLVWGTLLIYVAPCFLGMFLLFNMRRAAFYVIGAGFCAQTYITFTSVLAQNWFLLSPLTPGILGWGVALAIFLYVFSLYRHDMLA